MMEDWKQHQTPEEACGIIGIYQANNFDAANLLYFGLMALQHRGQDSAGIYVSHGGYITGYKDDGLLQDVFDKKIISILRGDVGLGHVKYRNNVSKRDTVAQPFIATYDGGQIAVAMNGALTNSAQLRQMLVKQGAVFQTETDCEIITALIAQKFKEIEAEDRGKGPYAKVYADKSLAAIHSTLKMLKGAFAIGILADKKLICARDRNGIRPLSVGKFTGSEGYVFASETVAFDIIGAELISEVQPAQMVVIGESGIEQMDWSEDEEKQAGSICAFEFVYFARPDALMNGVSVHQARENAGMILAKEHPVEADCVIGVPDSGVPAAIGYAQASGIPNRMGLIKNRYIGRSFIQPTQTLRELAVKLKLNPVRDIVEGKRIVLIDDSIVRGTTSMKLVQLLKSAGAAEVHMRISCPEIKELCPFGGIDIDDKDSLISNRMSVEEIRDMLGADSLGFLSLEGLLSSVSGGRCGYCSHCLIGECPKYL